ncbi:cell division topological specificity factor MinE [Sulfurimonas sp. MAG313]|nr:cell division topological specificity factor MinE [Sulfurimonas sp. MAG313]MDF1880371.1 cell division topological specificity factor MinE [Sulfurimonas sp. MAG313]
MSLFESLFGKKETSASVARDRLKLVLAHERASNALPYMEEMKTDILEVIKKYTKVKDIHFTTQNNQNIDVLEMEIILK